MDRRINRDQRRQNQDRVQGPPLLDRPAEKRTRQKGFVGGGAAYTLKQLGQPELNKNGTSNVP